MSVLDKYQRGTGARRKYNKETGKHYYRRAQSSYLHFHMPNIDTPPPMIIDDAKSQILYDFAYGFAKLNASSCPQIQTMSFEQLQSFLKVWVSAPQHNQAAGQAMANTIAQKLQNDPYTGAGIERGFNQAFGEWGKFSSLSSNEVLAEADYVLHQIETLLTSYINVFWSLEDVALLDKSFQLYKQGQAVSSSIFSKFNSKMFTQPDIAAIDAKAQSNFKTLGEILSTLNEIVSMGQAGMSGADIELALTEANITKFEPLTLAKSVGSIFNALGGEQVGETVGAYAANYMKEKDLKEVDEMLKELFNANGFTTIKTDTTLGQNHVTVGDHTVQQKGDWSIILQNGNVTVQIPVSQKLYQSARKSNTNASYISAQTLPPSITAQSIGLNSLLHMTLLEPTSGMFWFEQQLAVLSKDNKDIVNMSGADSTAVNLWNEFKEAAPWLGLFRALVGTGGSTKQGIDFTALLIVNSHIFSVADILKHLTSGSASFISPEIPDFDTIRKEVTKNYKVGTKMNDIDISDRHATQMGVIRTFWGKRFKIEIDMAMAASL